MSAVPEAEKGWIAQLVGSARFYVFISTVIGLVANDVFHLGLSDQTMGGIAAAAVSLIVGLTLRKPK